MALFIELLSPVRLLSLAFQNEEVDIVNTASNIEKTKRFLKKICDTTVFDLLKVKSFLNGISETEDGKKIFQGVRVIYHDNAIDSIDELKSALSPLIDNAIEKRLENDFNNLISRIRRIGNYCC